MAGCYDLQLEQDEMQREQGGDVAINKVTVADGLKITEMLGKERRDHLLSLLCLYRHDADGNVGNMAGRVLRSLCENLKKDQQDVIETLMAMMLENLVSPERWRQGMGARCIGSMVSMMYDKVMGDLLPLCLRITDPDQAKDLTKEHRTGVLCLALFPYLDTSHLVSTP